MPHDLRKSCSIELMQIILLVFTLLRGLKRLLTTLHLGCFWLVVAGASGEGDSRWFPQQRKARFWC